MTRYLALVYREDLTYSLCRRGCCGEGRTPSLFEKCYTEDRSEVINFLVKAHVEAARERSCEERYGDRVHSLVIDGFPDDEYADETSEEDAEKRRLLAEMDAIKAEVAAEVAVQLEAEKVKAAEKERLDREAAVAQQRAADLSRLAELARQQTELQIKLGVL